MEKKIIYFKDLTDKLRNDLSLYYNIMGKPTYLDSETLYNTDNLFIAIVFDNEVFVSLMITRKDIPGYFLTGSITNPDYRGQGWNNITHDMCVKELKRIAPNEDLRWSSPNWRGIRKRRIKQGYKIMTTLNDYTLYICRIRKIKLGV